MTGFLIDKEGKPSGKRLAGYILLAAALVVLANILFIVPPEEREVLVNVLWPVLSASAGCFGVSVAERRK